MFIKIDSKHVVYSEDAGKTILFLENSYYLNFNKLVQIEFSKCLIDKRVLDTSLKLKYLIKLYVLVDEGVWNFMTLYFTKYSHIEFQRIKKVVKKQGMKMSDNNHKANQANDNKGTSGTNQERQQVRDNRSNQLNPNHPEYKGSKDK